jgi:hypothetical protein
MRKHLRLVRSCHLHSPAPKTLLHSPAPETPLSPPAVSSAQQSLQAKSRVKALQQKTAAVEREGEWTKGRAHLEEDAAA